jgi:hypothetical protein
MSLKDEVPTFVKGSPALGDQLRDLAAVVTKLCELLEAPATPPADGEEAGAEDAGGVSETPAEPEAPAAPKTTSKPATKAAAK